MIVFTAFADTARYLYDEMAPWARSKLGLESALVTGAGGNQTTLPRLRKDLASILTSFAPRTKERPEDFGVEGEIDLLIATDCISEGQNLQDCDWLINYDIHWNPVRIIQRFGRIDRIGAPNECIQLVNFWPNLELEEYLRLEQRVSGRMVLLDISATGEENLIEQQSGDPMNDLEYRRKQLLKLQDAVIDLEDLSSGVSIADLTLTDFRIDLADYLRGRPDALAPFPLGSYAVTTTADDEIPPGMIFCLRAEGPAAARPFEPGYPLAPYYLAHVGEDGAVLLSFTQAKQVLDRLKTVLSGPRHAGRRRVRPIRQVHPRGPGHARCAKAPGRRNRFHRGAERRARGRQPFLARGHACIGKRVRRYQRFRGRGLPSRAGDGGCVKPFDPVVALALPAGALVDRRVPKTLLIENGAPTAADKRRIREGVEEVRWLAALKPTTVGVAEYRDAVREYLEIAVLKLTLRSAARLGRLTELVPPRRALSGAARRMAG